MNFRFAIMINPMNILQCSFCVKGYRYSPTSKKSVNIDTHSFSQIFIEINSNIYEKKYIVWNRQETISE